MSCRRASMSDAHACSNLVASDASSLHEKLHSVEAARAKELQAHGQLVQQLQTQLASQCQTAKELQLAVAKLRAEKCRLEAEAGSSLAKLRALEEKANGAERQHERWTEDYRQRLLTKDAELTRLLRTIEELKREKNEAALVDAERTSHAGSIKRESERIMTERDDARLALAASTQDVAQLATRLAVKQAELDAERKKTEQMHRELETQTKQLTDLESRIQVLTRACERLEITRLRVAAWGRVRVGIMERDVRFRDAFLEWKAQTLETKTTHNQEMRLEAQQRLDQLVRVRNDLHGKLQTARTALEATKAWLQHQRDGMQAWEEICKAQFCSVILPRFQQEQAETTRVCDEKVAAVHERLQTEHAQCNAQVAASRQLVQNANATRKRHVDALLGRIRSLQMQQLCAHAFQGWKDVYLRNVVAETTHAVMVARAAQSLVSAPPRSRLRTDDSMTASTRQSPLNPEPKISLPLRQPQRSSELLARGEEEGQWKRWRRVAPSDGKSASPSTTRRSSLASAASTTSSAASTNKAKSTAMPAPSTSRRRASLV